MGSKFTTKYLNNAGDYLSIHGLFLLAFSLILLVIFSLPVQAQTDETKLTWQQKDYLAGYEAIKRNDRKAIARYKKKLKDYPLAIYLNYHDYRIHIKDTPNKQVLGFIKLNKDSYLSDKLYQHWLKNLAKKQHWTTYLKYYKPQKSQTMQCYQIQALANRNQIKKALKLAKPIWQNSTGLNKACKPIDKLLRENKKLTGPMIWKRINLAMNKRKISLVKKLKKDLSKKQQKMVDYWLKVYKDSTLVAKPLPKSISPTVKKQIFTHGIRSLASRDAKLAKTSLDKFYKQYGLNRDQYEALNRKVALRTAYKYAPQAADFLQEVNSSNGKTEDSLRWQAQVALRDSNWSMLLEVIELMPKSMQSDKQWLYWKARALEASGEKQAEKAAKDIYKKLSKQRNYYAFLAADKLNSDYQFNPNPVKKRNTKYLIEKYPELPRIVELNAIDWPLSANREWHHLLNRVDRDELQAIALLANDWNQHSQAIRSLAKAKKWHDLELRFPTPHKGPVIHNADKNKIDPAWVYGVMRRESAFSENIKSHVGAVGLMQLMPKTAQYIGKKIGAKRVVYKEFTEAKNNIELGSAYLSYLSNKFNDHKVLATAAYNAGPRRVDRWLPTSGELPADQWIDAIPFTETRNYVKAVLEYMTIFKSMLSNRYDRLQDIMPPVNAQAVNGTDPKHP